MKDSYKNFLEAAGDYGVMSCDLFGCLLRTMAGNYLLEKILGDSEKFKPIGLDVLVGHEEIDENPKPGERAGHFAGSITGLLLDFLSLGSVPAAFLLYDVGRSVYHYYKET